MHTEEANNREITEHLIEMFGAIFAYNLPVFGYELMQGHDDNEGRRYLRNPLRTCTALDCNNVFVDFGLLYEGVKDV